MRRDVGSSACDEAPLVDVDAVTFQYAQARRPCVCDATLRVCAGARVLVVGANGSGKSTLLALIAGQRRPQRGCVRILGADPFDDTQHAASVALVGAPWPPEAFFGNTTIDTLTSPPPSLRARRDALAAALHLRLDARLDRLSSGERRRVQLLHGLLPPSRVVLLDECGTDLDVAERRALLQLVRRECEARRGCCVYATHIFDGLDDWATHVAFVAAGRVHACVAVDDNDDDRGGALRGNVERVVLHFMTHGVVDATRSTLPRHDDNDDDNDDDTYNSDNSYKDIDNDLNTDDDAIDTQRDNNDDVVVTCAGLTYKDVFADMHFTLHRGERVLLCGCNGAGKSTLLAMLGGRLFFANADGALRVCGRPCYDDMAALHATVAYSGSWWATPPPGQMRVRALVCDDFDHNARAQHLARLLAVDVDWDVRYLSSGEQKRVQLLLHLTPAQPRLLLLDEATSDLDVDQRHRLLRFLYDESVQRGVTVVYATHIFGGLRGWPTTALLLDRSRRGVHAVWRSRPVDATVAADDDDDDGRATPTTAAGGRRPRRRGAIDLDALARELVALKARETV